VLGRVRWHCHCMSATMTDANIELIRERAHQLWERAGSPEGREQEFGFEAERELRQKDTTVNADEKSKTFTE
jgi:DUF2934 family protein